MKKIVCAFLAAGIALSLTGCGYYLGKSLTGEGSTYSSSRSASSDDDEESFFSSASSDDEDDSSTDPWDEGESDSDGESFPEEEESSRKETPSPEPQGDLPYTELAGSSRMTDLERIKLSQFPDTDFCIGWMAKALTAQTEADPAEIDDVVEWSDLGDDCYRMIWRDYQSQEDVYNDVIVDFLVDDPYLYYDMGIYDQDGNKNPSEDRPMLLLRYASAYIQENFPQIGPSVYVLDEPLPPLCGYCKGWRYCPSCYGKGTYYVSGYGVQADSYIPCEGCQGSGVCWGCGGTGLDSA